MINFISSINSISYQLFDFVEDVTFCPICTDLLFLVDNSASYHFMKNFLPRGLDSSIIFGYITSWNWPSPPNCGCTFNPATR